MLVKFAPSDNFCSGTAESSSRRMAEVGSNCCRSEEHVLRKRMLAGAVSGGLADGLMYPMMTVKSRLQVQGSGRWGSTGALNVYGGPLHAIRTISANEGWRTLYKGYTTIMVGVPSTALYMTTYQTLKRLLPGGQDNHMVQFGSGIIATFVQAIVAVPVEVIRQRQMVQTACEGSYMIVLIRKQPLLTIWALKGQGVKGELIRGENQFTESALELNGSLHTAKSIYQLEGGRALYRGFLLNQMLCVPFNAVFLPLWEASKHACAQLSGATSVETLEFQYELGSAFFPSAIAAALTNPMDVIKTRIQVQGKSNVYSRTQYSGAWDAAKVIFRDEGMTGFTRGMTSRMMWVAPSVMICFTTYDQLMKWLSPSS